MTRKRWQELAIVLLIIAPLMALIWLPILTSDTKPWEAGDPIPDEPPSESQRVYNEAGFSIVSPKNWTARNQIGMIHLTPKQVFAGRSKAGIVVSLHQENPGDGNESSILVDALPLVVRDANELERTVREQRALDAATA